jgi:hypothetical protein
MQCNTCQCCRMHGSTHNNIHQPITSILHHMLRQCNTACTGSRWHHAFTGILGVCTRTPPYHTSASPARCTMGGLASALARSASNVIAKTPRISSFCCVASSISSVGEGVQSRKPHYARMCNLICLGVKGMFHVGRAQLQGRKRLSGIGRERIMEHGLRSAECWRCRKAASPNERRQLTGTCPGPENL